MEEPNAEALTRAPASRGSLHVWAPLVVIALLVGGLIGFYVYRHAAAISEAPLKKRDFAQEARAFLEQRNFKPLSASLEALLADAKYEPIPTQAHSLLLQPAPEFTLADVTGKTWTMSEQLKEGPVLLVFYYGYHCDHCVSQLFALDKDMPKFRELGVQVVAVSADPPELTRERFKQYGPFAFPVLSDPGNKIAQQYETYIPNPKDPQDGDLLHGTFIISRTGKVSWANRGEGPFTENRTLLHEVARSEGRTPAAKSSTP